MTASQDTFEGVAVPPGRYTARGAARPRYLATLVPLVLALGVAVAAGAVWDRIVANDTTYGLAATVYTENVGRAHRIVKRLKAGSVQINCQLVFDHDVPFGGYKQSGWGHEFGKDGLEAYLKQKTVWAQL